MQPEGHDAAYLWDMVEAAREIRGFVKGIAAREFLRNRMIQMAVERAVEIIGEAARHVSDSFKQDHPEIPWRKIVAQRHVLAHEYGDIKQDRMWDIATKYAPELIAQLEPLMPPLPPEVEG